MIKPTNEHKKWLKKVSEYFGIPESKIYRKTKKGKRLSGDSEVRLARQVFYRLCFIDNINLYRLSIEMGKNRITILSSINNYSTPWMVDNTVKKIFSEKQICPHCGKEI